MQPIAELPVASILIVDDRPANLLTMEVLLEPLGHEVISARSGPEALRALLREDFALIVMDVDMPGMDGIKTVELIKKSPRHCHIPILFVTAVCKDMDHVLRAYETGAVDYVMKPCDEKILRMKVSALVDVSLQRAIVEKRAEVDRKARAEAEDVRSAMVRNEFLTTVSHELRTPLTTILLNARMLQKPTLSPEHIAQAAERIVRSATAQARVIDNMLEVSRIVAGKLEMRVERTDAILAIQKTLDALRPTALLKRVALTEEIEPKKALIMADPARVQQILWELVLNGIRFTPPGGRVEVRVRLAGAELEMVVSDTGQGIPAAHLLEIFRCFGKAGEAGDTPAGLGVGLALARKLVELHGGSIRAESEGVGRGATFTVHLPHARRLGARAEQASRSGRRLSPALPRIHASWPAPSRRRASMRRHDVG